MKVYLDNAATTRLDPRVLAKMKPYLTDKYANASAIYFPGQQAFLDLRQAKKTVAKILHGEPDNVIFTSGATESNNFIIKGVARANRDTARNKIIISAIEHPCVREAADELKHEGFKVEIVPVNQEGIVEPAALEKLLDKKTILVSVMAVNNEIGTVQDIAALAAIAHRHGAYFHTDAVQAVPYLNLDIQKMAIDFLSLSAHKFYGPKGVGLAYINRKIKIRPLLAGGGQEDGYRSGTYNLPGIVGLAAALELAYRERGVYLKKVRSLRDYLWKKIQKEVPEVRVNGSLTRRSPANLNVMFGYVEGEAILIDLSSKGVCVSTGSACSAADLKSSYVLRSIGLKDHFLNSNIRFSLGRFNTKAEIDYTVNHLRNTVKRLRSFSPIK
ncbi:TPA: cysteine desulfurase NifS [Candidatus Falkowbacteria bacterium]|nr:MAG: Cysteine desulfurase NifS [Candidatus Falkowbacteria bacterium GW2011_GWF2_43_32]HBA36440.1 cysteine desulfurase NifS [Candidatus Falkowbacteria bacterium]